MQKVLSDGSTIIASSSTNTTQYQSGTGNTGNTSTAVTASQYQSETGNTGSAVTATATATATATVTGNESSSTVRDLFEEAVEKKNQNKQIQHIQFETDMSETNVLAAAFYRSGVVENKFGAHGVSTNSLAGTNAQMVAVVAQLGHASNFVTVLSVYQDQLDYEKVLQDGRTEIETATALERDTLQLRHHYYLTSHSTRKVRGLLGSFVLLGYQ